MPPWRQTYGVLHYTEDTHTHPVFNRSTINATIMTTQLETALEAVETVISRICYGVGTIHMLAPSDNTLAACLRTIQADEGKSKEFKRKFAFSVDLVIEILPYTPGLKLNDLVIQRYVDGLEEPFNRVANPVYNHNNNYSTAGERKVAVQAYVEDSYDYLLDYCSEEQQQEIQQKDENGEDWYWADYVGQEVYDKHVATNVVWVTKEEDFNQLGISQDEAYDLIDEGKLKVTKLHETGYGALWQLELK